MIKIAPSILSADFTKLGDEIRAAEAAGADMLHIDVMDGHFVPNITVGPMIVEGIRKVTKLPLDVHLMISDPDKYLHDFASAGADYLTVHAEATAHLNRTLQCIKESGIKAGVSLNPATPVCALDYALADADLVLVMSVNPSALDKIKELKGAIKKKGLATLISVDGGVKPDNAVSIVEAGADILVMGSAFFRSGDYAGLMKKLRQEIK